MCSKLVQMCSNVFKRVQMFLNVLKTKFFKTCSNVLVMAVTSGYGWVLGGNGFFLWQRLFFGCDK